jgi:hypothetical protein
MREGWESSRPTALPNWVECLGGSPRRAWRSWRLLSLLNRAGQPDRYPGRCRHRALYQLPEDLPHKGRGGRGTHKSMPREPRPIPVDLTRAVEGRQVFLRENLPVYKTPEEAVKTYPHMYQYSRNIELFYETPVEVGQSGPRLRNYPRTIVKKAFKEKTGPTDQTFPGPADKLSDPHRGIRNSHGHRRDPKESATDGSSLSARSAQ